MPDSTPAEDTSTDVNLVPEGGTPDAATAETGQDAGQPTKGNREAKYRTERNSARESLAAAEARIEAMQLREVERLAADLAQPSDLFEVGGVTLADLLSESGDVDNDAVTEAVSALIEQRPGLALNPTVRATDPSQGRGGNPAGRKAASWSDLKS